ncbi:MAG TPA: hypothetical protein VKE74_14235, partial [Gemmataceae bacterium]|nr:hypothetical protein [Gemmataceae bacterium]
MAYPTPPAADGDYPVLGSFRPVVPVYVIGDSHALAFSRLTFEEGVTGATFATRARYIPSGFTGAGFWSEAGGLHPELLAALEYEGLLRNGRAVHFSTDRTDLAIAQATEQPQVPPVLIITCGDIDVRGSVVPLLRDDRDFIPPDPTPYPHTDRPLVPFDLVGREIAGRVGSLVRGALKLQAVGFTRTYLHGVVPPTADDARFRLIHGYDCPAATRYKAARAFNDHLAAECGKNGLPFVDVWPETTTPEGYLRPEYELDGVHLSREAVRITLHKVLRHALGRTYLAANYPRYELYYRRCLGRPAAPPVPPPAAVVPPPTRSAAVVPPPTRSAASRLVRRAARVILPHAARHALRMVHRRLRRPAATAVAAPPPPPPQAPLVEVANRPPEGCTAADLPPVEGAAESWVRPAVEAFRAEGIAVLRVER